MGKAAVLETDREEWKARGLARIELLAARGVPFTADLLRDAGLPEPAHPNAWGALFKTAAAKGLIQRTGYTTSTRSSRRHSAQAVWLGAHLLF